MKKFYLGAFCCLLAMGASAQTLNTMSSVDGYLLCSIGKEYTSSGKSIPYTSEKNDSIVKINLYNNKFEIFKSLTLNTGTIFEATRVLNLDDSEFSEDINQYVIITQSLFNDDEKIEFVRSVYDTSEGRTKALEIVNEDNEVLTTIECPENSDYKSYPYILKWDGSFYFAIMSRDYENTYSWNIYLIEKATNSIRKVNTAPLMSVMPVLAKRNSTVNVTLDAETVKNGGELIITDSNGRTVGRSYVDAGQTSVPVTTDRMGSGVYNITLTEKGKKVENARIIVK